MLAWCKSIVQNEEPQLLYLKFQLLSVFLLRIFNKAVCNVPHISFRLKKKLNGKGRISNFRKLYL